MLEIIKMIRKYNFRETPGSNKTSLFEKTFSAEEVAKRGYEGMIAGELDVLAGLTFAQKISLKSIPFVPKKILMKQIFEMQKLN